MIEQLDALIEAVEAGTATVTTCDDAFPNAHNFEHSYALSAYRGSLDAALALHAALLPGWSWSANGDTHAGQTGYSAAAHPPSTCDESVFCDAATAARALLLATLKAYRTTLEATP